MIKHVLKTDSWRIQISCFSGLYRGPSTISSCQGFWLARGTACTRCNFPGDLFSYLIWITRSPRAGCHLLKWWWYKLRGWKSYRLRIFQLDWLDSRALKNCSEGETHGLCRASCQCKIHAVGSDGWAADSVAFMLFWRFTSHCDRAWQLSLNIISWYGSGGDAILLMTLLFHVRRDGFSDRLQWRSIQRVFLENRLLIVLTMCKFCFFNCTPKTNHSGQQECE